MDTGHRSVETDILDFLHDGIDVVLSLKLDIATMRQEVHGDVVDKGQLLNRTSDRSHTGAAGHAGDGDFREISRRGAWLDDGVDFVKSSFKADILDLLDDLVDIRLGAIVD